MKRITLLTTALMLVSSISAYAETQSDMDSDGVADHLDHCPDNTFEEISKGIHKNGCPLHSDQDGTPDYRDQCPNTPKGVKTNSIGCPVEFHSSVSNKILYTNNFMSIH